MVQSPPCQRAEAGNVMLSRCLQKHRQVGDIDERNLIRKKETEVAATKLATSAGLATPPSMTKCQVGTPKRPSK